MTTPPLHRNAEPTVNPPDISTPETENPPEEQAVSRTEWSLGPLGIAAMVVLVLVDLLVLFLGRGRSTEYLALGLSFGQMGATILFASAATRLSWQWIGACYAMVLIMCIHFAIVDPAPDLQTFPMVLTIWGSYMSIALAVILGLRWLRQQRSAGLAESQAEERIQFGVRHLLILMTLLAAASLLLRYAIPTFVSANVENIIGWVLLSVTLVLVAVELRRNTRHLLWQLGGLTAIGIVCTLFVTWMLEFEGILFAVVVQMAILMMVMVVLESEHYNVDVAIEPRDDGNNNAHVSRIIN